MDTQDRIVPRPVEAEDALDRDTAVTGEAGLGEDGLPGGYDDADAVDDGDLATQVEASLNGWLLAGLIAGGVALAAGVAGIAYWRMQQQSQRPDRLIRAAGVRTVEMARTYPRRVAHMTGRRIEQLPVRQVQKRVADRVSRLFD